MSLRIILRAEAEAEFDEAFDFYEARRAGLGPEFMAAVQKVLDTIAVSPRIHAIVFNDVRKGIVRGFPFCIFYRVLTDSIDVLAVFHTSRNPKLWQRRAC
jgi:toxin ParE1/3/4